MKTNYDVIVIGGGPAGYTAALYAARAGLQVLVVEKIAPGGQMTQTTQIDNYPGFDEGVDGILLGMKMRQGAERFGAESCFAQVNALRLQGDWKEVETEEGTFRSPVVILATGADHRHLGIPRETELVGRGVGYCAACDGMFYRGKTVAVVGGGNSAVADALLLSRIAKKVILIHRRDSLRASKVYHGPLMGRENVEFCWNSTVKALLGEERLKGVRIENVHTGEERELELDGLFVSIGRVPNTALLEGQLALDEGGYVPADESTQTELPGVFAAGDLRKKSLRQVVTAAADGAVAAHYGELYLSRREESSCQEKC